MDISNNSRDSSREEEAGSFLASLKRDRHVGSLEPDSKKKARSESYVAVTKVTTTVAPLCPYPFFNYVDHSRDEDPDPYVPLTAPGRVPNFPAKMHAILSRADLAEIICWSHHGRSWKVLKPREFEARVIPKYFEHAKFSSFVRQANGWGFRRITSGRDRNAYYHPHFLRGLPHLCKQMKRPGIAEKTAVDPDHEPDLAKISEMYPLPLKSVEEEVILLPCTLREGPKARMPVQSLSMMAAASRSSSNQQDLGPNELESLKSFQHSLSVSETRQVAAVPQCNLKPGTFPTSSYPLFSIAANDTKAQILAAANELTWSAAGSSTSSPMFAAGFAAAMKNFAHLQQHSQQKPQVQHQQHNFRV